jgi:hypothetical protein
MTDNTVPTYIQLGDEQVDASMVEVPESRTFRNAWVLEGEAIVVDMDLAREIARDKIRQEREPLLKELDTEYLRLSETGTAANEVIEAKQMLRDAPADTRLDAAQDPESLEMAMTTIIDEMKDAV